MVKKDEHRETVMDTTTMILISESTNNIESQKQRTRTLLRAKRRGATKGRRRG